MGEPHHNAAMPASLLWLALGGGLLLLVLLGADSDGLLLVGGVAALLLALAAAALPQPLLQGLLFGALVAGGGLLLRRWSRRRSRGEAALPPPASADQAEVIAAFDGRGEGRVRWQGQSWAAQAPGGGSGLAPGDRVLVLGREGNRLSVLPAGELQTGPERN